MRRALTCATVLVLAAGVAQAQVPSGPEFQVNTYTTGDQRDPRAAIAGDESAVVTWQSQGPAPPAASVALQRYAASGAPVGGELVVAATGANAFPSVAASGAGGFIVNWTALQPQSAMPGEVWAQRFDATGTPQGAPVFVNGNTSGMGAVLTARPWGSFVAVWANASYFAHQFSVRGRVFTADGVVEVPEFSVSGSGAAGQPAMAAGNEGEFVVAWYEMPSGAVDGEVWARRYDATAAPQGSAFRVNTVTSGGQDEPAVAAGSDGSFVVVWEDRSSGVVEVHGQRFDPAGAPLGGEFPVKAVTGAPSIGPAIASDAAGDFVVAWVYADTQLLARRFDASGAPRGPAFVVTPAPVAAVKPSIASDPVGNLFITWTAPGPSGLDVRARRFGGLRPTALRVDTSGNGIFEPGETVDLRPTWLNFNGATLTVAAGASRFTGPPEGGVSYTLADASGDYGTLADGASAECGDCYRVGLGFAGVRPALHWDATLDERITPDALGQTQRWRLHLGESFADVPRSSPFYRFVETLLHNRVTAGCTSTDYCPGASTRREQMAAFVLAAREGAGYAPAACGAPAFDDVPPTSPFCRWIEELARRGVVTGCSTSPPLYCPATAVSREQMAVFVLRALDPALNPPACTAGAEMFADVPASNAFCRWIEELARRGVVTGCASGLYCPGDPVTREQMAVFLGATFGLALYTI